jgi:hypothetical protein
MSQSHNFSSDVMNLQSHDLVIPLAILTTDLSLMMTERHLCITHTLQILAYHNIQQLKTTLISGFTPPILIHLTLHSLMPAFTTNLAEMIRRTALSSLSQPLNNKTWLGVMVTRSFSFWMEHLVSIVPTHFFSSAWLSTTRTRASPLSFFISQLKKWQQLLMGIMMAYSSRIFLLAGKWLWAPMRLAKSSTSRLCSQIMIPVNRMLYPRSSLMPCFFYVDSTWLRLGKMLLTENLQLYPRVPHDKRFNVSLQSFLYYF